MKNRFSFGLAMALFGALSLSSIARGETSTTSATSGVTQSDDSAAKEALELRRFRRSLYNLATVQDLLALDIARLKKNDPDNDGYRVKAIEEMEAANKAVTDGIRDIEESIKTEQAK